jgi:hypothetical protein
MGPAAYVRRVTAVRARHCVVQLGPARDRTRAGTSRPLGRRSASGRASCAHPKRPRSVSDRRVLVWRLARGGVVCRNKKSRSARSRYIDRALRPGGRYSNACLHQHRGVRGLLYTYKLLSKSIRTMRYSCTGDRDTRDGPLFTFLRFALAWPAARWRWPVPRCGRCRWPVGSPPAARSHPVPRPLCHTRHAGPTPARGPRRLRSPTPAARHAPVAPGPAPPRSPAT